MEIQSQESRIILAINTLQSSKKLSRRQASKIYNVPETTLRCRMNGRVLKRESRPIAYQLIIEEEQVAIQYIIDLDTRGFTPRLTSVKDMANLLYYKRGANNVSKH